MKREFSKYWVGSKQPRKQRKYLAKAPLHIKAKLMSSGLSKELRERHKTRSIPIRKGDTVKVLVGNFKKKTGKISIVDRKKIRVAIEGLQRTKKEGSKVNVWFHPSNLQITELNTDDKKRLKNEIKEKQNIHSENKPKKLARGEKITNAS